MNWQDWWADWNLTPARGACICWAHLPETCANRSDGEDLLCDGCRIDYREGLGCSDRRAWLEELNGRPRSLVRFHLSDAQWREQGRPDRTQVPF